MIEEITGSPPAASAMRVDRVTLLTNDQKDVLNMGA